MWQLPAARKVLLQQLARIVREALLKESEVRKRPRASADETLRQIRLSGIWR